jgi:hypothetical protein
MIVNDRGTTKKIYEDMVVKFDRNNCIRAKIMKSKCSIRYFKEEI